MAEEMAEAAATTNEGGQVEAEATQDAGTPQEVSETTEESSEAAGAPEKYEFTAPEGSEFDSETLKVYEEAARELNLTNDAAQKLIDKMSPIMAQRQMERIEAVRNEWTEKSKTDKEFGGDKLNENLAVAQKALTKFGTDELKALLNESGIGNHPEVIRFFYRAGKSISEDTFVGGHQGEGKAQPRDFNGYAAALYNKQ